MLKRSSVSEYTKNTFKTRELNQITMDELNLNKVGSDTVQQKTGRSWQEWIEILDSEKCVEMTHKEIVATLNGKYQVGDWWSQMVTVGYEQYRGLRDVHQKIDGYSATASKTMPYPAETIFVAWTDPVIREQWLKAEGYEIRKTTENRIVRISWKDGSSVEVNLYPKGKGKTQVSLQHNKLASSELVLEMKEFWKEKITSLLHLIEKYQTEY